MDGQINSVVRFLTENGNNGILPLNTDVIQELKAKHPEAKDRSDEAFLYGPIDDRLKPCLLADLYLLIRETDLLDRLEWEN